MATTWYVTQSGSGNLSGNTLANSLSNSLLGSAAVAAGDTVIINGSMSSLNLPGANGTSGNPITFVWAFGAKLSSAASRLCFCNNRQWMIFDGGPGLGIVECTANGSQLAFQNSVSGFDVSGSSNLTFKNITFQNLYVHTLLSDTTLAIDTVGAVYANGYGGNMLIQNCSFNFIGWCLPMFGSGNLTVTGCSFMNYDHGIAGVAPISSGSAGTFTCTNNTFGSTVTWDTTLNTYHHDGVHLYWAPGVNGITNVNISGNTFYGDWGSAHNTAHLFLELNYVTHSSADAYGWTITNNVHLQYPGNYLTNGFMAGGGSNTIIAHNTYVGVNTYGASGVSFGGPNLTFMNNVVYSVNTFIGANNFLPGGLNGNIYASVGQGGNSPFSYNGTSYGSFAAWQGATGQDINSAYMPTILLNADGTLPVNSTLRGAGASMSLVTAASGLQLASINVDRFGRGRANPPAAGALEYFVSGVSSLAQGIATVSNGVVNVGTTLLTNLIAYWNMDGISGSNETDQTGNGHTAVNNGTIGTTPAGVINSCRTSNGNSSNFLSISNSAALNPAPSSPFSWAGWLVPATLVPGQFNGAFSVGSGGATIGAEIYDDTNNKLSFNVTGDGSTPNFVESPVAFTDVFTWHHFTCVWDGALVKMSHNGGPFITTPYTGPIFNSPVANLFRIGTAATGSWFGNMDEVGFWMRALTQAEAFALYNNGAGLPYSSFGTPVNVAYAVDTFVRGSSDPISNPMSDGVGTWSTTVTTSPNPIKILSNQCLGDTNAAHGLGIVTNPIFTSNQTASVTLGSTTGFLGAMVRVQGTPQNYKGYALANNSTPDILILESAAWVAGVLTETTIASINVTSSGHTLAIGTVISLEATGSNPVLLKAYVNGVQVGGTQSDSTFLYVGGQPGIYAYSNVNPITGFSAVNG